MLLSAALALASPVFLECTLTDRGGESVFDVQVNEDAGTVTYFTRRSQRSVRMRAFFTPNLITFGAFEIDRRDLTFRRDNTGSAFYTPGEWTAVDEGTCVVSQTERAI